MIKIEHYWISFSAINTRVIVKIRPNSFSTNLALCSLSFRISCLIRPVVLGANLATARLALSLALVKFCN